MSAHEYPIENANADGWSDWVHPLPGYRMACCDCGLVHGMEFRIDDLGQVNFRVRRLNRNTAALRREIKKRTKKEPKP